MLGVGNNRSVCWEDVGREPTSTYRHVVSVLETFTEHMAKSTNDFKY